MFLLTNGLHIPSEDFITPSVENCSNLAGKTNEFLEIIEWGTRRRDPEIPRTRITGDDSQMSRRPWIKMTRWMWMWKWMWMWMPHVDASELPHDGNAKWFVSLYGNCCLLFSSGLVLVWVLFFGCRLFSSADKQLYLDFGFLRKRIFIHCSGRFFQIFLIE